MDATNCIVGSNWNNGTNAGTFQLNVNNALTNSNSNIGAHHLGLIKSRHWVFPTSW